MRIRIGCTVKYGLVQLAVRGNMAAQQPIMPAFTGLDLASIFSWGKCGAPSKLDFGERKRHISTLFRGHISLLSAATEGSYALRREEIGSTKYMY